MKAGRRRRAAAVAGLAAVFALCAPGVGFGHGAEHAAAHHDGGGYARAFASYPVPEVTLVDAGSRPVALAEVLRTDRPVMLNFIFTSCKTICPVMVATFAGVRQQLAAESEGPLFLSISIDPEHDDPARLADYAHRLHVEGSWQLLTGEPAAIRRVQEAFGVYRGDKMSHVPATFMRASPAGPWLRIDGFASAAELVDEYRGLLSD